MARFRLAISLLAPLLGAGACYSERLPPPNFRYACGADGDCSDQERCIRGLCQVPCTSATGATDCEDFLACLNGVCVSSCELPAEDCNEDGEDCTRPESRSTCPAPQTCMDVGFGGAGGGSFFGGGSTADVGVCGQGCTSDSCPDGELCLEDFCV